jgi:hypothetical protein
MTATSIACAGADARRAAGQARSRPLVSALKSFFEHQPGRLSGGSDTVKIIRYGLGHWDGLTRFLDDGRIELDTKHRRAFDAAASSDAQKCSLRGTR